MLLLPGTDGTGRLFGPLQKALPSDLRTQVISYPTNELLGYDTLTDRIDLPNQPFALVAESFSGPIGIRLAARAILAVDVMEAFASNQVPTLYVRGRRDRLVPPRVGDQLARVRTDLEMVDIHAPHLVLQSEPDRAASIIADFVARSS